MDGFNFAAAGVAAVIATLGLWWFQFILKDVRRLPKATRYGIYALIWLAYFVLIMILAARRTGAGA
ncbi:MAG: hypothetical protein VX640_01050 [Pseudomonadota bacterium]|nr:hypothetical protein [Pseudomonadota bacterium]